MGINFFYSVFKSTSLFWLSLLSLGSVSCQEKIRPGIQNSDQYLALLENHTVGVVAHQASLFETPLGNKHLVDVLLENKISVQKVFAPEHGFRGDADAGEKISDQKDSKTQLPIISLYGKNRKPTPLQMQGIEMMIFDLQDVGVRFYTYLSTLHYIMEACAENNIPLVVLDRPNPNTHYLDGPVLEEEHRSFVGMHPVPIVYGMTLGEYAKMINGEKWLADGNQCDLTIIPIQNFTHQTPYELTTRPSPNLPNNQSILLYPSLCLLEPTIISVGRGTDFQFQIYGHPDFPSTNFSFTPQSNFGSKNPKHKGRLCYGKDLTQISISNKLEIKWLMDAYVQFPQKELFFKKGFERISGVSQLRKQIERGESEQVIRDSWKTGLDAFKKIRKRYLIYP